MFANFLDYDLSQLVDIASRLSPSIATFDLVVRAIERARRYRRTYQRSKLPVPATYLARFFRVRLARGPPSL